MRKPIKWLKIRSILAIFFCGFCFSSAAFAAEEKAAPPGPEYGGDLWTRSHLTGDWWGGRTYLSDHGLDLNLRLSQYWQSVESGGVDQNDEWGGTMDYRIHVDTNKLLGTWKGFSIDMHARTRWGQDVLADAGGLTLPNTGLLMPLPGDYHDTDITGLIANQYFPAGDKHLGLLTLGKLDILDAVSLFFPSVGYGQEGFWNVNALVSAMPWFGAVNGLSLYGGWLATINKEHQTGQSAIIVTGTENVTTEWSSLSDSFEDGVWISAFHRFLYKIDDKPGYFMIFGGYSTRDQTSNEKNDFVFKPGEGIESTDEKKPWDIALYLSQVLWQAEGDPSRKATILTGGTFGPDNPQFAQYNFFTALEGYGLMASRPHDRMGVAGWHNWLSDNYKDLVSPVVDLQDTWGFELYYNFAVNKWAHLTADLQLLENAQKDDDLAVVSGVRLVIDF
ncbi:MAG: carbohydrate porin [Deltaproteobacteria bacterium]|jgi:porin|nr:carbohydrate porin [Deltaproteobacteria bacterium]